MPTLEQVAGDGADLIDTNANWINGKYAGIFLYDTSVVKHAEAVTEGTCELGDFIKMGDYQGGVTKVTQALAISANSEHPAEAAALIQYLMAEEEGVVTLGDTRGIPANKQGLSYLDLSNSAVAAANAKVLAWSQFQLDPTFERSSLTGTDGSFYMALQMASYGELDSTEAAKAVIEGVNKELK
jgi:oligogalacturonide transport system substrate-binding protein